MRRGVDRPLRLPVLPDVKDKAGCQVRVPESRSADARAFVLQLAYLTRRFHLSDDYVLKPSFSEAPVSNVWRMSFSTNARCFRAVKDRTLILNRKGYSTGNSGLEHMAMNLNELRIQEC
jgi:hypothetical protein